MSRPELPLPLSACESHDPDLGHFIHWLRRAHEVPLPKRIETGFERIEKQEEMGHAMLFRRTRAILSVTYRLIEDAGHKHGLQDYEARAWGHLMRCIHQLQAIKGAQRSHAVFRWKASSCLCAAYFSLLLRDDPNGCKSWLRSALVNYDIKNYPGFWLNRMRISILLNILERKFWRIVEHMLRINAEHFPVFPIDTTAKATEIEELGRAMILGHRLAKRQPIRESHLLEMQHPFYASIKKLIAEKAENA